jgi:hypothetical protein
MSELHCNNKYFLLVVGSFLEVNFFEFLVERFLVICTRETLVNE